MTYPPQGPQGPYGEQPDPYGQQQPQYGGYPQQQPQPQPTGQFGAYDPNAQYGGGYQQYGGFGGPPPPQKSKKGPVIAIVAVVVLLLAGLGITGFVAPGFFLSDKGSDTADDGGGTGDTTSRKKDSGADDFIDALVSAADGQDTTKLKTMKCSGATDTVDSAIDAIDSIDGAERGEVKDESADEVQFVVTISYEGKSEDDTVTIKKDGDDWCWHDIEAGTPTSDDDGDSGAESAEDSTVDSPASVEPPASGDSDGEKYVQSFLDKLNGGDGAGAAAMSCSDSTSQSDITEAAAQHPDLEMDPAGTTADASYVGADLKGTLAGADATGRTSAFLEDGKWCIYTFFAS
jgi:hypothetical protein